MKFKKSIIGVILGASILISACNRDRDAGLVQNGRMLGLGIKSLIDTNNSKSFDFAQTITLLKNQKFIDENTANLLVSEFTLLQEASLENRMPKIVFMSRDFYKGTKNHGVIVYSDGRVARCIASDAYK